MEPFGACYHLEVPAWMEAGIPPERWDSSLYPTQCWKMWRMQVLETHVVVVPSEQA